MIDFDLFLIWAESKFNDVIVAGDEIRLNSIFCEDTKHHLYCAPSGGKYAREDGVYQCWKTLTKGTLIGLVAKVESCSYSDAREILGGGLSISILEDKLDQIFNQKPVIKQESKIKLPECFLISSLSGLYKEEVEKYLNRRKIPLDNLYYSVVGDYKHRVIIPYFDKNGNLIYFNARSLGKNPPKYKGPPKELNVGKADVLFCTNWESEKIYLTEGEFDAISLSLCGLAGVATGGKTLSNTQLEMLRSKKVCLAPDNDEKVVESASPGRQSLTFIAKKLFSAFIPVSFVFPPAGFKDWNEMLVRFSPEIVSGYISKNEKKLDPLLLEQLNILN